ncbi:MAG: NAD-binding protein [Candidatus Marinimicrobia bacterium]|nr:NAD-binding protein [Candidatus Neomarinimicrobiota bacterium]
MDVSLLGTGLMGYPMVETLLEANMNVTAYNRTRKKASPLKKKGADIAESPSDAIQKGEVNILVLTDAAAIDEVLFTDNSIDFMGKTIIQMGTISPEQSENLMKKIKSAGGDYFEAPVLGNKHHARSGELDVMVGGTDEQYQRWSQLLKIFGTLRHVGPVGTAAALKLALNQLIASLSASFGLSLKLVQKRGVDVDMFMSILRDSALYAPQFDKKLDGWLSSDYSDPNFPTEHLLKDVELMLQASRAERLETASLEGVKLILNHAIEKGYDGQDYSSLFEGIEK